MIKNYFNKDTVYRKEIGKGKVKISVVLKDEKMKNFLFPLANFITILDYLILEKVKNKKEFDQHFENVTNELAEMAKDIGVPTQEKTEFLNFT